MNQEKNHQVVMFKLTDGRIVKLDIPQLEQAQYSFKQIIRQLNEQVPFEFILIEQVNLKKIISKMNQKPQLDMNYDLYDARQLLKVCIGRRELQNENDTLKSEKRILSEENQNLRREMGLLQFGAMRFESQLTLQNRFESDKIKKQIDEQKTQIKNQMQTIEEMIEKSIDQDKKIDQLESQLEKMKGELLQKEQKIQEKSEKLDQGTTFLKIIDNHNKMIISDQEKRFQFKIKELEVNQNSPINTQLNVLKQKTIGLVQNFNKLYQGVFSTFRNNIDVYIQDSQCQLFNIQIDDQAQFDQKLLSSYPLSQLSQFISLKSLGIQIITKTIQPAIDNTFFEGHLFQIKTISDLALNHDPNLKNKTFIIKTLKTTKDNGCLPKNDEESKKLSILNFVSQSICNQFISLLNNKGYNHPEIKFPQQYIIKTQKENNEYFYQIEELIDGEFIQLTNSDIPLKDSIEAQFSNSLVYYSYQKSQYKLMLTRIEGIKGHDQSITLYDSVICSQQGFSSHIDLGIEEMNKLRNLIEKDDKRVLGKYCDILKYEFLKV